MDQADCPHCNECPHYDTLAAKLREAEAVIWKTKTFEQYQAGAAAERARIVAWLRGISMHAQALQIERGGHAGTAVGGEQR